jgi:hypothetical protein
MAQQQQVRKRARDGAAVAAAVASSSAPSRQVQGQQPPSRAYADPYDLYAASGAARVGGITLDAYKPRGGGTVRDALTAARACFAAVEPPREVPKLVAAHLAAAVHGHVVDVAYRILAAAAPRETAAEVQLFVGRTGVPARLSQALDTNDITTWSMDTSGPGPAARWSTTYRGRGYHGLVVALVLTEEDAAAALGEDAVPPCYAASSRALSLALMVEQALIRRFDDEPSYAHHARVFKDETNGTDRGNKTAMASTSACVYVAYRVVRPGDAVAAAAPSPAAAVQVQVHADPAATAAAPSSDAIAAARAAFGSNMRQSKIWQRHTPALMHLKATLSREALWKLLLSWYDDGASHPEAIRTRVKRAKKRFERVAVPYGDGQLDAVKEETR